MKITRPHSPCRLFPANNWMEKLWEEQKKRNPLMEETEVKQLFGVKSPGAPCPPLSLGLHRDFLQDEQFTRSADRTIFFKPSRNSLHTQQPGCSQSRAVTAAHVMVPPTIRPSGQTTKRKVVYFHFKDLLKRSTHLKDLVSFHCVQ